MKLIIFLILITVKQALVNNNIYFFDSVIPLFLFLIYLNGKKNKVLTSAFILGTIDDVLFNEVIGVSFMGYFLMFGLLNKLEKYVVDNFFINLLKMIILLAGVHYVKYFFYFFKDTGYRMLNFYFILFAAAIYVLNSYAERKKMSL